jgi:hypothetical protein
MTWYTTPEFKKLQKEYYKKLKEDGFHDLEGGMEGHLLQQRTPTRSLGAAISEMHTNLSKIRSIIGGSAPNDPKRYEKWLDTSVIEYYNKGKNTYYDAAQYIATKLFMTSVSREMKFSWSMHSDGYGEEVIADELQLPRSRIRKYLYVMKERIMFYIDKHIDS